MKRELLIKIRGGKNQTEMANKYGVSQQSWSYWENGLFAPPPYIMKQLELDSGIPMEELFSDVFYKK